MKVPEPEPAQPDRTPKKGRYHLAEIKKPVPQPTPETQHFWDGTKAGEIRLQRCNACHHVYFPPRPFCPKCASKDIAVFTASGRGRLFSYVINHRSMPGFEAPYAIAVVELDEGPRMMTNMVDVEQTPEALQLDMPVEVTFEQRSEDIFVPLFRPVRS
ncbi:MAG: OB-fold domain-containing protein [Dehalococcoidia bacterium]